ncbi:MAG: filamentous hemagglutinin N-terminal domain-containing protein, partial [Candidatus Omnitrophica bacterium]|nr:filamentous hemagglutinin N-terminal domain-containing protein [Candidatus Omnitrophota bacterium]
MKREPGSKRLMMIAAAILMACAIGLRQAVALPEVRDIAEGEADIHYPDERTMHINASPRSIINYYSFDINENECVIVNLPTASDEILNRVLGTKATEILGKLNSNGVLILVNEKGIIFGKSAEVNVAGLIASTRDITDSDFLNANYIFQRLSKGQLDMLLLNSGSIKIQQGGFGVLIAGAIENQGTIIAEVGTIAMAAGDMVRLNLGGNGLISLAIDKPTAEKVYDYTGKPVTDQIKNTGTLKADGGTIMLHAESLPGIFEKAINLEGFVSATKVEKRNGKIVLSTGATNTAPNTNAPIVAKIQSSITEVYLPNADIRVKNVQSDARFVTLLAEGLKLAYLKDTELILQTDRAVDTMPGVVLAANSVRVIARQFGSTEQPLNISANQTHIQRVGGPIGLLESLGIGSSIMLRGPPEGFGAIVYRKETNLTLEAQVVQVLGAESFHFYGNTTFYNFNCTTPGTELYFAAGSLYTFNETTYIHGEPGYAGLIKLLSSVPGEAYYTQFYGTQTINYVAIRDAYNLGSAVKALPSTNLGNCKNWDTDPVWNGLGLTYNWSDALNWDTQTVPTEFDTVTFNATSHKDSYIDAAFGGTIANLTIDGYTGTIYLYRTLNITGAYTQKSGAFRAQSYEMTVRGDFRHTGGSFYCPSNNLYFKGSVEAHFDTFYEDPDGNVYVQAYEQWWAFIQAKLAWENTLPYYSDASASWTIINPEKALKATIDATGWMIEEYNSDGTASAWTWKYIYKGIGREGDGIAAQPLPDIYTDNNATTVVLDYGDVEEWLRYTSNGIEQGFTINSRPAGDGELVINGLIITGLTVISQSDEYITFGTSSGMTFTYRNLAVYDANGVSLGARMEVVEGDTGRYLRLIIDDANAAYPLTVDPLSTEPSWTATGENSFDSFGYSVSSAGDVNGDGYSDVLIGANAYSSYTGKAYAYYGSGSGLSTSPDWTATGENTYDEFGYSVSSAGDVNGDGYSDVLIGAQYYSSYTGKAYAYYGSGSGLSTSPDWSATGENSSDYFGWSVSSAGDVNGDGYSDVLIGANAYSSYTGKAYAYYGSGSGLSTSPDWTATGENTYDEFGYSVSSAGDVNGDGYSDVLIGAQYYSSYTGKAYAYYGS